jgi:hypothetical protein
MTTAVAGCACALRLIHPGWSFAFISDGTLVAASMSSTIAIYGSFVRSFMRRLLPGSVIPRVAAILTMAVIVVPFAAILIELGSRSALTALVVGAPAAIAMALVWIPVGRRNRRRWSKVAAWVPGPGLDELSRRAIVKAKRTASVEGGSVERKTPAGAQRSESSVRGS